MSKRFNGQLINGITVATIRKRAEPLYPNDEAEMLKRSINIQNKVLHMKFKVPPFIHEKKRSSTLKHCIFNSAEPKFQHVDNTAELFDPANKSPIGRRKG